MEPISPELCLVDPVLARRARELLPLEAEVSDGGLPTEAPVRTPRARRGRLTRLGGWVLAASLLLNVALLWPKSTAETAPAPVVVSSPTPAPKAPRSPSRRPTPKRTSGVLAAKAEAHRSAKPAKPRVVSGRRVLSWRAAARADLYDFVLWRGHRRVADLWPTRSKLSVAAVACAAGKRLARGRYLWFVYPVVDRASRRYGALAGWGAVDIDPRAEHCFGT